MKLKKSNIATQFLILLLAGLVLGFMMQMAQAQVLQTQLPQESLGETLMKNTSLSY